MNAAKIVTTLLEALNAIDEDTGYPVTFISGAIGENTYKTSPSQPMYTGSVTLQGLPSHGLSWTKFYISVWLNRNKGTNGEFLSFQISKADMQKEADKEAEKARRDARRKAKDNGKVPF